MVFSNCTVALGSIHLPLHFYLFIVTFEHSLAIHAAPNLNNDVWMKIKFYWNKKKYFNLFMRIMTIWAIGIY